MTDKQIARIKRVRKAHNVKQNNSSHTKAYKRVILQRRERVMARADAIKSEKLHRQQGR